MALTVIPKTKEAYWGETPQIHRTSKNVFRYYVNSKRLAISLPDFYPKGSLEKQPGKTVTIDLAALEEEPETLRALIAIFTKALESAE